MGVVCYLIILKYSGPPPAAPHGGYPPPGVGPGGFAPPGCKYSFVLTHS